MESHLKWPDYLILVGFLAISLAIGIYHSLTGGRQKTTEEFIMANRRLKVIPTTISMLVSFQSAIMVLGATAEMYSYGIQYLVFCNIAVVLSLLIVERIIVPWIYPLKLVSVFDYLERRYTSKSIRIFGAMLGIVSGILYMGVAMYAPSAALEAATGFPIFVSVPLMAVVSITYTALGGMRAVIWTDVFQFLVMIGGMVAIFVKGLLAVGGITNVFRLAEEEGRLNYASFSLDPRLRNTAWSLNFGLGLYWVYSYGLSQAGVQRYSAVETLSKARATMLLNIPPLILTQTVTCLIGLIVLAFYTDIKCDPIANKEIVSPNELLPYFVVTIFSNAPGFAGLFLATLYGGALSSVSSSLSGSAANCWEDILKWKLNHLPETTKAVINRFLVVIFGSVSVGVAFIAGTLPGPMTQVAMAMMSSVSGPLLAIFLLGAIFRQANWKGAILGAVVGLLSVLWLSIGALTVRDKLPLLPPVSVEQCSLGNSSFHFFPSVANCTNDTFFEIVDGNIVKVNCNQTMEVLSASGSKVTELQGLENFYSISYLWMTFFGIIVSGTVGIIASLIMRDRDLEAKVSERLLLRFRCCGSAEENENKSDLDDKNNYYTSPQELESRNTPENGRRKHMNMRDLNQAESQSHNEGNGKLKRTTENVLLIKDDKRKPDDV